MVKRMVCVLDEPTFTDPKLSVLVVMVKDVVLTTDADNVSDASVALIPLPFTHNTPENEPAVAPGVSVIVVVVENEVALALVVKLPLTLNTPAPPVE